MAEGSTAVLLNLEAWEALRQLLEDLEDMAELEAAQQENEKTIAWEHVVAEYQATYLVTPGVLRLKGETGYRAWVGDYRILYEIDDTVQMMISIEITIVEAGMGERIRIRPFPPILLAHLTTKRQQL